MWPGATRSVQITPEGHLYNGEWRLRIRPLEGDSAADPPKRIAYEEGWRPVAHWRRHQGPLHWSFEAAALPTSSKSDTGLFVTLLIRVRNEGDAPREARLEMTLDHPGREAIWAAADAPRGPPSPPEWGPESKGALVHAWCEGGATQGPVTVFDWKVAPGETRSARVIYPAYATPPSAMRSWARVGHDTRIEQERTYWQHELDQGAQFELPDATVVRALRSAAVMMLACRERVDAAWAPIGSPFQYRDIWLRDAARVVQALTLIGHTDVARAMCRGLLELQWPQGAFLSQRGQLDGTGQALWAFEQALSRPEWPDTLDVFVAAAGRAWAWCEWQRRLGKQSGWIYGRMMPFGDPRDNELISAQLVGNDLWTLAGYRATLRLLDAAGKRREALQVDSTRVAYVTDFERALASRRAPDLPPAWQPGGYDWGNLTAVYPTGVLPPGDRRMAALARRLWASAGGAGLLRYGRTDSLHYYLGADLATWALLVSRRAQADSVLSAMLFWRNASGGAGELFSRQGDYAGNPPPHGTSAAALVTLVRHMLIYDETDTLKLTLGARDSWWSGTRVRRAPTHWGTIDLEFHRDANEAKWTWTPVAVWTELTLPPGYRTSGPVPSPARVSGDRLRVLVPPGTGTMSVRIEPGGST